MKLPITVKGYLKRKLLLSPKNDDSWKSKYLDTSAENAALEREIQQLREDYARLLVYYQELIHEERKILSSDKIEDLYVLGEQLINALMYYIGDKPILEDVEDLLASWKELTDV